MHHEDSSRAATTFSPSISLTELQILLRSSRPPSASHTAQIPDILASLDGQVRHCDAQLRRLRSEIASLENQRKWAQKQQKKYKSLLAPVRRLPAELLDYIFSLYGSMNKNRISIWCNYLPGSVLMSVCARWRDLAQSCTRLWTNISLDVSSIKSAYDYESLRPPLQWCLDHAGDVSPLDITFDGVMSDDPLEEPAVVEMLTARASRWRQVTFVSESSLDEFPSLAKLEDQQMPLLESVCSLNKEVLSDAEFRLFCNAPILRKLILDFSLPETWKPDDVPHSMTRIRSLVLKPCGNTSGLFRLLPAFPSLRSLYYNLPSLFLENGNELLSQSSTSLSSLYITVYPKTRSLLADGLQTLLKSACFPSLKRLSISFDGKPLARINFMNAAWPADVRSFLLRSRCSLTTLQLEDAITSDDDLIGLLMQTPELRHLVFDQNTPRKLSEEAKQIIPRAIRNTSLTMAFIEHLHAFGAGEGACYVSGNALVPKLQTLSLKVLGSWFKDDQLFCDVARSRWVPNQDLAAKFGIECLKSVQVKILGREPDLAIYESLNELGMKVEVFGDTSL